MSERVRGVVTVDTGRVLDDLLNAVTAYPVGLTGLCIAESGLREQAARWGQGCDVSFGLVQQSVCFIDERIPGVIPPAGDRPSDAEIDLIRAWYFDAAHALQNVGPRFDWLMARAGGDALLACCYWNAPNLDWTRPDAQHAANRENYRRALAHAESYRVTEVPMPTDQNTYTVGPGVQAAMAAMGDEPRGNEAYISASYSLTPGRDYAYLYSQEANQVYTLPKT